jgi:hypothetical protein
MALRPDGYGGQQWSNEREEAAMSTTQFADREQTAAASAPAIRGWRR